MKKIICLLKGHIWGRWLWAEKRNYAAKKCRRCDKLKWGCTLEYGRTFGSGQFNDDYEIISRR